MISKTAHKSAQSRRTDSLGRILIADDEETFLVSTADLLRREGYQCDCVPDAATALEMLKQARYDLLISDIKMPGNRELELIRQIRTITDGMPIVLVTGYPSVSTAVQSIQLPVEAYLIKPIDFDQLLGQVKTSIKNFRLYRAVQSVERRFHGLCNDLQGIEAVLNSPHRYTSSLPLNAFLELTFRNIVVALSDVKRLAEGLTQSSVEQEACHLFNCPRLSALRDVLWETIDVLEETKSAFKSKKLGELRLKLRELVRKRVTEKDEEKLELEISRA